MQFFRKASIFIIICLCISGCKSLYPETKEIKQFTIQILENPNSYDSLILNSCYGNNRKSIDEFCVSEYRTNDIYKFKKNGYSIQEVIEGVSIDEDNNEYPLIIIKVKSDDDILQFTFIKKTEWRIYGIAKIGLGSDWNIN